MAGTAGQSQRSWSSSLYEYVVQDAPRLMSVTSVVAAVALLISQASSDGYSSPPVESTGMFVLWASANLPLFALVIAATVLIGLTFERFAAAALLFSTALPAAVVVAVLIGTLASGNGAVVLSPALRSSMLGVAGVTAWNAIARVMLLPVPRSPSSLHWSLHVSTLTVWLWVLGTLSPILSHFVDVRVDLYLVSLSIVLLWVFLVIVLAPLAGYSVLPLSEFIQALMTPLSYEYASAETVRRKGTAHCRVKQFSHLLGMRQVLWAVLWAHVLHTVVDIWQLTELVCLLDSAQDQGVQLGTEALPGTSRYAINGFFACWDRSDSNTQNTHWIDVLSLCTLSAYFFATVAAITAYIITSVSQTTTQQAAEQQQMSAMLRWLSHECRSPIGIALLAIENATQEPMLALRRKAAEEAAAAHRSTTAATALSNSELLARSLRARKASFPAHPQGAPGQVRTLSDHADEALTAHTHTTNPSSTELVHGATNSGSSGSEVSHHAPPPSSDLRDTTPHLVAPAAQGASEHLPAAEHPAEADSKRVAPHASRLRLNSRPLIAVPGEGRPPPSNARPAGPHEVARIQELEPFGDGSAEGQQLNVHVQPPATRMPRASSASDALESLWDVYRALDEDLQSIMQPLSMMGGVLDNMLVYLKSRDDKREAEWGAEHEEEHEEEHELVATSHFEGNQVRGMTREPSVADSARSHGDAALRSGRSQRGGRRGRQEAARLNVQHSLLDLEQMMQHLVDLYDVTPPRLKRTFLFQLDGHSTRLQGASALELLLEHGLWVYAGVTPPTLKQALVNLFTNALKYGSTVGVGGAGGGAGTMASRGYSTLAMSAILQDQGGLVQGAGGGVSARSDSTTGKPQAHIGVHVALRVRSDVLPSSKLRMPEDSAYLSVACGTLELTVSDHGQGLNPEELLGLFEPFSRLRSGTQQKGTGLGLWLMRELLHSQGGELTAESAGHGRGSKFTITLPAATHVQHAKSLLKLAQPEQNMVQKLRNPGGYEMFRVVTLVEADMGDDSESDSEDAAAAAHSDAMFGSGSDVTGHSGRQAGGGKASLHANLGTALPALVPTGPADMGRGMSSGSESDLVVSATGARWRTSQTMSRGASSGLHSDVEHVSGEGGGSNTPSSNPPSNSLPKIRARGDLSSIHEGSHESATPAEGGAMQRNTPPGGSSLGSVGGSTPPPTSSLGGGASRSMMSRRGSSSSSLKATAATGAGLHVLVVDDSAPLRKQLTRTLRRHGCTITAAEDGKDALAKIARATQQIHVILCDLSMPVMSGPEFAAALKRVGALRRMSGRAPSTHKPLRDILLSVGALPAGGGTAAQARAAVTSGQSSGAHSRVASGSGSGSRSDSQDDSVLAGQGVVVSDESTAPLSQARASRDTSVGNGGTRVTTGSDATTVMPISLPSSHHEREAEAELVAQRSRGQSLLSDGSGARATDGGGIASGPSGRGMSSRAHSAAAEGRAALSPHDLMRGGSKMASSGPSGAAGSVMLSASVTVGGPGGSGSVSDTPGAAAAHATSSPDAESMEELSSLFHGVAFLGLTGNGIQSDLDSFKAAGAHVVLTKPCAAPKIVATAASVLVGIHQEELQGVRT